MIAVLCSGLVSVAHHGLGPHVPGEGGGLAADDGALVRALLLQCPLSGAGDGAEVTLLLHMTRSGTGSLHWLRLHEVEAEHIVPLDRGAGGLEVRHGDLRRAQAVLLVVGVDGPDVDLQCLGHQFVFGDGDGEVLTKSWFGQIRDGSGAECAHHIGDGG